jgi:hypothetical protein
MGMFKGKDGKDGDKKDDSRTPEQKQTDVNAAAKEATELLKHKGATEQSVKAKLPPIKDKYKLVKLDLVVGSKDAAKERVHVHAEINPTADGEEEEIANGMEEVTVDFTCTPSKKGRPMLDQAEMKRQLAEGQAVMDSLTIAQWEARRASFFQRKADAKASGKANPEGRDPEGTAAQKAAKKKAETEEAQRLMDENPSLSADDAVAQAKVNLKGKVATHKLDQVAGGSGTDLSDELGAGREDFAIGAAWPAKCAIIEDKIKDLAPEVKQTAKMRIKITLDGKPVS